MDAALRVEAVARRPGCIEPAGERPVPQRPAALDPGLVLQVRVRAARRCEPCLVEAGADRRLASAALGSRPAAPPDRHRARLATAAVIGSGADRRPCSMDRSLHGAYSLRRSWVL